jgi:hypothetical protein
VETKTDDIDIITLPGYKFVMKNRKKITKNRSGGIMVGFKDNLAKHIDIVNTESIDIQSFMSEVLFILPLSPRGMSGLSLAFSSKLLTD